MMDKFEKDFNRAVEAAADAAVEAAIDSIQKLEIEIECPNCGKMLTFNIPKNLEKVYCRYCRQEINLEWNL